MSLVAGLLLALSASAAAPAADVEPAYRALLDLDPEARAEVVRRLVDEGRLEAPRPALGSKAADRGMAASVELRIARAREALVGGRPDLALPWLEPVRDDPRVSALYQEAVDEHVYRQRERAGRWFRYARRHRGPERRRALTRSREILADLARRHPGTIYADAVIDALSRVERTLDADARRTASAAAEP